MNIPLIDLKKQHESIKKEIYEAMQGVIKDSNFILGENVNNLERELARFTNTLYGIGVANGTDAIRLALEAYGIGKGDQVITTPFTFFATAEAISQAGATPVFVDIDEDTFNINTNMIEEKITSKTKAIIPVHLFGQPADMKKIVDLGEKYDLKIIEDACQAIGAIYKGKQVGSIGNAGCFSFFPTKNLGCMGDGGMIVTNDKKIVEKLRMLRFHGQRTKYFNEILGYNSRLDEIQAAILKVKFKYLHQWNENRRKIAFKYNRLLEKLPFKKPIEIDDVYSVYHLYVVQLEERDNLREYLKTQGVDSGIYYPLPLHLQKAYRQLGYKKGDFPTAENVSNKTLALPIYPEMTEDIQHYIVEKIKDFYLSR